MNNKAILLLSGGLDSLASCVIAQEDYFIERAIYIDYGQKAAQQEKNACENICRHYGIELQTFDAKWLAEISQNTALCGKEDSKDAEKKDFWIPNRNGLFVNIGACFAEALGCNYVIIGANYEEAQEFKDNSVNFVESATKLFASSTQNNVKLLAPLINMDKEEIIEKAVELDAPLQYVWSCYFNGEKHCGKCPSCRLLKNALSAAGKDNLQKLLF